MAALGEERTRMAADRRADVRAPHFAAAGSQKWLQVAIERRPKTLLSALRRCGAVERASSVEWRSPLREKEFKEYRDHAALTLAGVQPLRRPLDDFWPARGPVWDAIGVRSRGGALFLEAKAHIPETASPPSRASTASASLISRSLAEARRWYSPQPRRRNRLQTINQGVGPFYVVKAMPERFSEPFPFARCMQDIESDMA